MTTKRRILAIVVVIVLAAVALRAARSKGPGDAAERTSRTTTLRAAAVVVTQANLRDSVSTIGTLVADESVTIVGEISRRLVRIHVTEGKRVAKGDLLFELDGADLRASLTELGARRTLAAKTVERQKALLDSGAKAISRQTVDQANAELQAFDAQIEGARVTLAKTMIRAPFAGTVGLRRVSEGAWITPQTVLTTLHDAGRVKVDFTVPERYAASVTPGGRFAFHVSGRPENFEGTIVAIDPAIDAGTRSLLVRGVAPNPQGVLVPGAFATVDLELQGIVGGVDVPAQAVVPSTDKHAVWVLRDGRAELREIEIGLRTSTSVQILRGVQSGETVLTTNLLRLTPGAAVEIEAAGT